MGSSLPPELAEAPVPLYLSRADGMSEEFAAHAAKLATRYFQTFSSLQLNAIEPPAIRPWADVENIHLSQEIAWLSDAATALAENVLRDLGLDPETLRLEAERSLDSGDKLPIVAQPITSWTDGLVLRLFYGLVLQVRLEAIFGSTYIRFGNVAHELYFKLCQRDWPAIVGSPQRERVARAIEEEGKAVVQASIDKWWLPALRSIDDPVEEDAGYLRLGLKTRDNAVSRASFSRIIQREFDALGLAIPT